MKIDWTFCKAAVRATAINFVFNVITRTVLGVVCSSLMDEEKIQKASLNNCAFSYQQVFQAHRLATGGSTQDISTFSRLIEEAHKNLFQQDKSERG